MKWKCYITCPFTLKIVPDGDVCFYCDQVHSYHYTSLTFKQLSEGLDFDNEARRYLIDHRSAYVNLLKGRRARR